MMSSAYTEQKVQPLLFYLLFAKLLRYEMSDALTLMRLDCHFIF